MTEHTAKNPTKQDKNICPTEHVLTSSFPPPHSPQKNWHEEHFTSSQTIPTPNFRAQLGIPRRCIQKACLLSKPETATVNHLRAKMQTFSARVKGFTSSRAEFLLPVEYAMEGRLCQASLFMQPKYPAKVHPRIASDKCMGEKNKCLKTSSHQERSDARKKWIFSNYSHAPWAY